MALAQAEMLASPSGSTDLDQVEGMTRNGHGLYVLPTKQGGFADLHVGVLARGFFPEWVKFLGHDTSCYPKNRPKSEDDLKGVPANMARSLRDLFASMPEIEDLFGEVFDGPPGWVSVINDLQANTGAFASDANAVKVGSTYVQFIDHSGKVSVENVEERRLAVNGNWTSGRSRRHGDRVSRPCGSCRL